MRGKEASAAGETLLRRLRRLVARVATVKGSDRKQLLALLDDVETARRGLLRECAEIEGEMRQAAVRTTAIGAYLRNSQAGHGKRRS
jgi:cell division septum initiation protein DivIVA